MLVDITPHPQSIEEYIDKWITSKVIFCENNIITTVDAKGRSIKYYPVHPQGSQSREWLEKRMKEDLIYLMSI
jgi:hypothetical protein